MSSHVSLERPDLLRCGFDLHSVSDDGATLHHVAGPEEFVAAMAEMGARGLVIYSHPARLLAHALCEGRSPQEALTVWTEAVRPQLEVLRRWRRKLTVVQAPESDADRAAIEGSLAEVYGRYPAVTPEALRIGPPPDQIYLDLALLALGQDAGARDLLNELQARTLGPFDPVPEMRDGLRRLAARIRVQGEAAAEDRALRDRLQSQVADLEEAARRMSGELRQARDGQAAARREADELRAEQAVAQEAIDTERRMSQLLQNQIADLEEAMRGLLTTAEETRSRNRKLEEETDQVRRVLAEARSDSDYPEGDRAWRDHVSAMFRQKSQHLEVLIQKLEASRQQAEQVAQAQIHALQAENAALRERIEDLHRSTSWRITAPMRSVRQFLKR